MQRRVVELEAAAETHRERINILVASDEKDKVLQRNMLLAAAKSGDAKMVGLADIACHVT